MVFIPEMNSQQSSVPYYEDARAADGWEGQSTTKTIDKLLIEIKEAIGLLGGIVLSTVPGHYQDEIDAKRKRPGYYINYYLETGEKGKIEIAGLPCRNPNNEDKSRGMALYMARNALKGMWFLEKLSPGYSALLPFMLVRGEVTLSQAYRDRRLMIAAPPTDSDDQTVEGDYKEVNGQTNN